MKLASKETAWVALTVWWLAVANSYMPWVIWNTLANVAWATTWILQSVWNGIESVTEPVIGSIAPTAAPMVAPTLAWAYLWNKLWNYLFQEDQVWRKRAATVTGWVLWLATESVLAPYTVWAAVLYAWRKIPLAAAWAVWKWAWALWWGTWWFVWGGAKWAVKWGYNALTSWWSDPKLKPQVWF